MTSSDLDPVFVKALKLLQSRSKESYLQLKQMYDDVVSQRRRHAVFKRETDGDTKSSFSSGSGSSMSGIEVGKKREYVSANVEKLKQDLAELSEVPPKKMKMEPGTTASVSTSSRADRDKERDSSQTSDKPKTSETIPVKEKPRERLREIEEDIFFGPAATTSSSNRAKERERQEREEKEKQVTKVKEKKEVVVVPIAIDSGSDTEVSDDAGQDDVGQTEQIQFDLDIGNLSCVICNSMSISSTNRLVECQECHSLYHQDCHKPPVTEDVNDPRFVWYCCKCAKNLKKIVVKSQKKPSKPGTSTPARDSPVSKPLKTEPPQLLQPFKRPEAIKPTVVKETAEPGRGLVGLASLAKNLNSRPTTTTGTSSTGVPDSSKSRTDQPGGSSRPPSTKTSPTWGSTGGAFSSTGHPVMLGKTDKSGKTMPVAAGTVKSAAAVVSSSGTSTVVGSSSTVKMSQSTLMSADKRLQNMKKKAKLAEKRTR